MPLDEQSSSKKKGQKNLAESLRTLWFNYKFKKWGSNFELASPRIVSLSKKSNSADKVLMANRQVLEKMSYEEI